LYLKPVQAMPAGLRWLNHGHLRDVARWFTNDTGMPTRRG
jgi:hypothetical protein